MKDVKSVVITKNHPHKFHKCKPSSVYLKVDGKNLNLYYVDQSSGKVMAVFGGNEILIDVERIIELPKGYIEEMVLS